MTVRLILLAVLAVSITNAVVFTPADSGPEDMHFPVVRSMNNIISAYLDTVYTHLMIKVKFAKELAMKSQAIDKYIAKKADLVMKLIDYAGSRGIDLDVPNPQADDLTQCDMATYGCWKVSLEKERAVYKTLQDGYSSAGSHEDADAQAKLLPLAQDCLADIQYGKAMIARIDAKLAKANKNAGDSGDDLLALLADL